ncbi:MAG: DUF5519 family protein [Candidatus Krumholzibacteria bacterium]|nr:DUF5519 family protein [Candidatus Krumholzibacteria bacterium]
MIQFSGRKKRRALESEAVHRVVTEVETWPGVVTAPHQFGAVEFQLDGTEFGHIHRDGTLDVPFVRRLRNPLVAAGAVSRHRWVPNSGWVTLHVESDEDIERAVRLLRLSYLYRLILRPERPLGLDDIASEIEGIELPLEARRGMLDLLARRRSAANA